MSQNRALIESLARDRDSERYRRAGRVSYRVSGKTRSRAGWLLIGLGMRLVAGQGRANTRLRVTAGR
jgi:hypothetical protein